jgi:hypothetical protein
VLAVAVALDRRPYRPGKRNYIPIMIISVAGILVLGRQPDKKIVDRQAASPSSWKTPFMAAWMAS